MKDTSYMSRSDSISSLDGIPSETDILGVLLNSENYLPKISDKVFDQRLDNSFDARKERLKLFFREQPAFFDFMNEKGVSREEISCQYIADQYFLLKNASKENGIELPKKISLETIERTSSALQYDISQTPANQPDFYRLLRKNNLHYVHGREAFYYDNKDSKTIDARKTLLMDEILYMSLNAQKGLEEKNELR